MRWCPLQVARVNAPGQCGPGRHSQSASRVWDRNTSLFKTTVWHDKLTACMRKVPEDVVVRGASPGAMRVLSQASAQTAAERHFSSVDLIAAQQWLSMTSLNPRTLMHAEIHGEMVNLARATLYSPWKGSAGAVRRERRQRLVRRRREPWGRWLTSLHVGEPREYGVYHTHIRAAACVCIDIC